MNTREEKSKDYCGKLKPSQYYSIFIFLDITTGKHLKRSPGLCSLRSPFFVKRKKKMLIAASCRPTQGKAQTKLLNLEEGGKVRQPNPGAGKSTEPRRERVMFQNKGSTRNRTSTPPRFPAFQSARLGFDFSEVVRFTQLLSVR